MADAEAIGQPTSIIFTPEDIAAHVPEKEMKTAIAERRALDERWHQRADGSRFFMSGTMRPIRNPHLSGFVKVARDMTEQKMKTAYFNGILKNEWKYCKVIL